MLMVAISGSQNLKFFSLQRQQVVMTRKWAEDFPCIHFSSMHPGWADTPGLQPQKLFTVSYN